VIDEILGLFSTNSVKLLQVNWADITCIDAELILKSTLTLVICKVKLKFIVLVVLTIVFVMCYCVTR